MRYSDLTALGSLIVAIISLGVTAYQYYVERERYRENQQAQRELRDEQKEHKARIAELETRQASAAETISETQKRMLELREQQIRNQVDVTLRHANHNTEHVLIDVRGTRNLSVDGVTLSGVYGFYHRGYFGGAYQKLCRTVTPSDSSMLLTMKCPNLHIAREIDDTDIKRWRDNETQVMIERQRKYPRHPNIQYVTLIGIRTSDSEGREDCRIFKIDWPDVVLTEMHNMYNVASLVGRIAQTYHVPMRGTGIRVPFNTEYVSYEEASRAREYLASVYEDSDICAVEFHPDVVWERERDR